MKVGNINNSLNFGNVYGVYGSISQITNLYDEIVGKKQSVSNLLYIPANDVFAKSNNYENDLVLAAKTGDQVALIVTGDEYEKISNKKRGWKTKDDIAKNVQKIINLNFITDKQKREIIKSVKN